MQMTVANKPHLNWNNCKLKNPNHRRVIRNFENVINKVRIKNYCQRDNDDNEVNNKDSDGGDNGGRDNESE